MVRTGTCEACGERLATLRPLAGVHDYPSRIRCATLPWNALLSALSGAKEAGGE